MNIILLILWLISWVMLSFHVTKRYSLHDLILLCVTNITFLILIVSR